MNATTLTSQIKRMWPNGYPVRFGNITGSALSVEDDKVRVWLDSQAQATFPLNETEPRYRRCVATITVQHRVGGEHLVSLDTISGSATILTGPTPWGSGSWGPFPPESVSGARDPLPSDSWPVSGCPSERWTVADLERALERASQR